MDKDSKRLTEAYEGLTMGRIMGRKKNQARVNILSRARHRNGISGAPFEVFVFEDKDENGLKVAIDFGGDKFAVLDVDQLKARDPKPQFSGNDYYAAAVRGTHAYNAKHKEVSRYSLTPDDDVQLKDFI
jgi:hypothetical protein